MNRVGGDIRGIHFQLHDRLGDLGADAHQHDARAQQPGGAGGPEQIVADAGVDHLHSGDVDDHHVGLLAAGG
jgi:hypothetical protein